MRRSAFTLVEMLVVIAVVALLATVLLPSLSAAREQARRAQCASQLRHGLMGLSLYSQEHAGRLPPFAMSDAARPDWVLSSHWGGTGRPTFRPGTERTNLWALADAGMVESPNLLCPSARLGGDASYFHDTQRFSTYAVRVPYSWDLFRPGPPVDMGRYGPGGVFCLAGGGVKVETGFARSLRVPQVRTGWQYRSAAPGLDYVADMASGAWLADTFWRCPPTPAPNGKGFEREMDWWHGDAILVGYATGDVRTLPADAALAEHVPAPDGTAPPDDGTECSAGHAEHVWKLFDQR